MIAILHMVIDIAFFTVMICLFSKRLDELEDWQDKFDERLNNVETKTKIEAQAVDFLLGQVEKRT